MDNPAETVTVRQIRTSKMEVATVRQTLTSKMEVAITRALEIHTLSKEAIPMHSSRPHHNLRTEDEHNRRDMMAGHNKEGTTIDMAEAELRQLPLAEPHMVKVRQMMKIFCC